MYDQLQRQQNYVTTQCSNHTSIKAVANDECKITDNLSMYTKFDKYLHSVFNIRNRKRYIFLY
jgi:hypothetical protein